MMTAIPQPPSPYRSQFGEERKSARGVRATPKTLGQPMSSSGHLDQILAGIHIYTSRSEVLGAHRTDTQLSDDVLRATEVDPVTKSVTTDPAQGATSRRIYERPGDPPAEVIRLRVSIGATPQASSLRDPDETVRRACPLSPGSPCPPPPAPVAAGARRQQPHPSERRRLSSAAGHRCRSR